MWGVPKIATAPAMDLANCRLFMITSLSPVRRQQLSDSINSGGRD
jgi:hypothetical protein